MHARVKVLLPMLLRAVFAGAAMSAASAQAAQPDAARHEASAAPRHSVPYREHRVGGRLERVIVIHKHGLTETYRNNRPDTIWTAEEDELGEVPNMGQWIIRTW